MQKRSNGTTEGYVRYVVNGKNAAKPFGYCECRYSPEAPSSSSSSSSTSNRDDVSSTRYARSIGHRRPKRQLSKNLFVPNLDDRFEIFQSFGDVDNEKDVRPSDDGNAIKTLNNRHSSNIPFKFEPIQHSLSPYLKEPAQIPSVKLYHSTPQDGARHPPPSPPYRKHKIDPLRKSKRINYSEFVEPKAHDKDKDLPDFTHHKRPDKVKPIYHHHPHQSSPLPHFHRRENTAKCTDYAVHSLKDCKQCDISKLLSRIQADYFACCDDCRQKMMEKYASEGCSESLKSSNPKIVHDTPCKKHETKEIPAPKCGCDHNRNILEKLKKISEKLCELTAARSAKIEKEKEIKSSSDVKKNLLQQLNKIYDKLSSLKSTDDIEKSCSKRGGDCKCSKCNGHSKQSDFRKTHN